MHRLPKFLLFALALVVVLGLAAPVLADATIKNINAANNQLTITENGKDTTYTCTDNCKIILQDGREGKLSDLKEGQKVALLWEKRNDQFFTNAILDRQGTFADAGLAQGTVKSVNADQHEFVVTDSKGKDWMYHLDDNGKVRVSNKDVELNELKANDKVIVVWEKKGERYNVLMVCDTGR